jgi:hypothetical protein
MHCTPRWGRTLFEVAKDAGAGDTICLIAPATGWAVFDDVELLQAGWIPTPFPVFSVENYWPIGDAAPDYRWSDTIGYINLVELPTGPAVSELLEQLYKEGPKRASSDGLLKLLEELFSLVGRKRFGQLEALLEAANLQRLAPEFAVAILRATANSRRSLSSWSTFREATRAELKRRGLSTDEVLVGLE